LINLALRFAARAISLPTSFMERTLDFRKNFAPSVPIFEV